jgi:putative phosphoribosyl transferase
MNKYRFYLNRYDAGEKLAQELTKFKFQDPLLIGIPRGGIEIAEPIADKYQIPIHAMVLKKLPVPGNPEAGFGAITEDGTKVLNDKMLAYLNLTEAEIERISQSIIEEIKQRTDIYGSIQRPDIEGRNIIVADDGIATGYTLIAAIKSLQNMHPLSLTLVVPVSSKQAYEKISPMVERIICPIVDDPGLFAVANYYKEWYDLPARDIKKIIETYHQKYST